MMLNKLTALLMSLDMFDLTLPVTVSTGTLDVLIVCESSASHA